MFKYSGQKGREFCDRSSRCRKCSIDFFGLSWLRGSSYFLTKATFAPFLSELVAKKENKCDAGAMRLCCKVREVLKSEEIWENNLNAKYVISKTTMISELEYYGMKDSRRDNNLRQHLFTGLEHWWYKTWRCFW